MSPCVWAPGARGSDGDALIARPFGARMCDLLIDFEQVPNRVIDAVLAACLSRADGSGISSADIASWHVAKRRQGLLAVAVATSGPRRILTTTCQAPACAALLDLEFDLSAFRQDWRCEQVVFEHGRLRLPRPADLETLGSGAPEQLARILFDGVPPEREDWVAGAEAALSQADPLGDLELHAECVSCGAQIALPLMLEMYLLDELSRVVTGLLDQIHILAFAYHWPEADIIALPEARRRHYLARIQEAWAG